MVGGDNSGRHFLLEQQLPAPCTPHGRVVVLTGHVHTIIRLAHHTIFIKEDEPGREFLHGEATIELKEPDLRELALDRCKIGCALASPIAEVIRSVKCLKASQVPGLIDLGEAIIHRQTATRTERRYKAIHGACSASFCLIRSFASRLSGGPGPLSACSGNLRAVSRI